MATLVHGGGGECALVECRGCGRAHPRSAMAAVGTEVGYGWADGPRTPGGATLASRRRRIKWERAVLACPDCRGVKRAAPVAADPRWAGAAGWQRYAPPTR